MFFQLHTNRNPARNDYGSSGRNAGRGDDVQDGGGLRGRTHIVNGDFILQSHSDTPSIITAKCWGEQPCRVTLWVALPSGTQSDCRQSFHDPAVDDVHGKQTVGAGAGNQMNVIIDLGAVEIDLPAAGQKGLGPLVQIQTVHIGTLALVGQILRAAGNLRVEEQIGVRLRQTEDAVLQGKDPLDEFLVDAAVAPSILWTVNAAMCPAMRKSSASVCCTLVRRIKPI